MMDPTKIGQLGAQYLKGLIGDEDLVMELADLAFQTQTIPAESEELAVSIAYGCITGKVLDWEKYS